MARRPVRRRSSVSSRRYPVRRSSSVRRASPVRRRSARRTRRSSSPRGMTLRLVLQTTDQQAIASPFGQTKAVAPERAKF